MSHSAKENDHQERSRRTYLRGKILHEHLEQVARRHSGPDAQRLVDGLTYASAISLLDQTPQHCTTVLANPESVEATENDEDVERCVSGGLSETDLKRFGSPSTLMTSQIQKQLLVELKRTLLTVVEFWSDEEDATEEERLQSAFELPENIRLQKERIVQQRAELKEHYVRTQNLVNDINEIHPRLEEVLINALTTLPPILNASRVAKADVLSMTIETCLLRLSLIRARAHTALYGRTSSKNPDATMSRALVVAHGKLAAKQHTQREEERVLDRQIEEYERLLSLVDGRDGGFAQVVKDRARVRSETQECKRDLRRLGWTGD
ncbi:hypothetical protein SCP_0904860 [Sparassis crispa]|uniref:Uncharacterized protein n=1 Tax=Sparassis crispa TaxID=139825 RepID=A0A401GWK4_9APHY|nr:hypothetical protein SCP_0904860 [Sparassis crispa]GBE86607.1 hypothetical protein SCP_0904860 [Sparassis crispa]